ncbi:MAG TPA: glycosyltransferase family 4 protein [Thermoanaerobaculia bacterium]|nr:glycosyltransferase family 4 protein [Thermoanaerobaculia bacterium]
MHLAFLMPGVGILSRGAEAFVVELAAALAREHGFSVSLYCRGEAVVPGVEVRRIGALPRDARFLNALYSGSQLGRKALDTLFLDPLNLEWDSAALAAFPGLWGGGYDAVIMEGGIVGAWLSRLLRRLQGVPFVDIAHGNSPKWEGAFARQGPDRVVVFTEAAARMIRERAPRARIAVIPHGIDLELFRPDIPAMAPIPLSLPRPIVLAAGAIDDHKRMHLAVEAVARLPQGSLVLLGEGPEAAAVDALAARLLPGRYRRTAVPRSAMPSWYAAADCFTLPSLTESFGLTYLEAMACGLAAVAPDEAVRREVVGEAGIYCDVTDPEAYAGALAAALGRDWGEIPRERARRFPLQATVRAYAELLRSLQRPSPAER